jgi:hypothetical protein
MIFRINNTQEVWDKLYEPETPTCDVLCEGTDCLTVEIPTKDEHRFVSCLKEIDSGIREA